VKIAFAGKGGSGKTTLSSLFVRHLASRGLPVVAIDADINQHLAEALGAGDPAPMGAHLAEIKEYLRGSNPRIASAEAMVKTTPPGRGSRLLRPGGTDPVHALAGLHRPRARRPGHGTGPAVQPGRPRLCYRGRAVGHPVPA
jgi:CO dehydrogenase maturation factor